MSDENIKGLESDLNGFAQKFEEIAMTLIAKMAEINDKLNRVTGSVEMVDKVRIQNVENKQLINQVKNNISNLTRRLDKLYDGGFVLPKVDELEIPGKVAGTDMLDAKIEIKSTEEIDDLSDLGEPPTMEELLASMNSENTPEKETPKKEKKKESSDKGEKKDFAAEVKKQEPTEPTIPITSPKSVNETNSESENIDKKLEPSSVTANEESTISVPNSSSNTSPNTNPKPNPKSNLNRISSPKNPKDVLNNLIVDIENSDSESEVGNLILQAKESIEKIVPFHTTYFEMLMEGGKIKSSKKPSSPELVKYLNGKINSWNSKF